jgi:precorrin-6B methylase 2
MRFSRITALAATAALAATLTAGVPALAGTTTTPTTPAATTQALTAFADKWYIATSTNGQPGHIIINAKSHTADSVAGTKTYASFAYRPSITDAQAQAVINNEFNKIAAVLSFAWNELNAKNRLVVNTTAHTLESHYTYKGKDKMWQNVTTSTLTKAQIDAIISLAVHR